MTILNSFSGSLHLFSSVIWTSVFLSCSFICALFLCLFIIFLKLIEFEVSFSQPSRLNSFFLLVSALLSLVPDGSDGKAPACNAGDLGLIRGSGRSPGEGNGNPLQYFCLENPMQRSLVGCSPWGHKESDTTERLNWTELRVSSLVV